MAKSETYIVDHTFRRDGESYDPGDEIELTEDAFEALQELTPAPVRAPEAAAPAAPAEVQKHPLTAETNAEIEAIVPEIDDAERLEAALEEVDTKGGQKAIQARLDELADGDEG